MKPTLRLLQPAALRQSATPPSTAKSERAATLPSLMSTKSTIERALAETREALERDQIEEELDLRLEALREAPVSVPLERSPGRAVVRVVGYKRQKHRDRKHHGAVPLPNLRVELRIDDKPIERATTDPTGLAVLIRPEDSTQPYELAVLAPNCDVVGCRTARGDARELIEIGYAPELEPAFERGKVWSTAADETAQRLEAAKPELRKLLEAQVVELEKALQQLERSIECAD